MSTESDHRVPTEITASNFILVEGPDDEKLIYKIAEQHGVSDLQLHPVWGKDKFADVIGVLHLVPGFLNVRTVGIVRDADASRDSAFTSSAAALRRAGFVQPDGNLEIATGDPGAIILIVPPDRTEGVLEDLCFDSVKVSNPAITDCTDSFLDCAGENGATLPHRAKSRAFAYIATTDQPYLRLGEAAEAGVWNLESEAFDPIRDMLEKMASHSGS